MLNNRAAIIALHKSGGRNFEIARELAVAKQTVSDAIKRYTQLGHDGDRPGRGRKRTVRTSRNRQIIRKRVKRNLRIYMRKIARETGLMRESIRIMAKVDLGLRPYKFQKAQLLTDANKVVRLERCRGLLERAAGQNWERILFADEKVFTIEQYHNRQNDRYWSAKASGVFAVVTHRQHPQSVTVWAGICATGKTPLVFIEEGVKNNLEVYRRDVLETVVLPWAHQHFGDQQWTFQQGSAPAHMAKLTQTWCGAHFPKFIAVREWPPYSPDLNLMDSDDPFWSLGHVLSPTKVRLR